MQVSFCIVVVVLCLNILTDCIVIVIGSWRGQCISWKVSTKTRVCTNDIFLVFMISLWDFFHFVRFVTWPRTVAKAVLVQYEGFPHPFVDHGPVAGGYQDIV